MFWCITYSSSVRLNRAHKARVKNARDRHKIPVGFFLGNTEFEKNIDAFSGAKKNTLVTPSMVLSSTETQSALRNSL